VYAGWESNLTASGAGTREFFENTGISTYISPTACRSLQSGEKLTWDDIWNEITQAGQIFGVPNAAADLIVDQQIQVNSPVRDPRGLTALWWSSGTDIPYVGGALGAPQLIMDTVGLTNIATDIADTWGSLSWEQIIADDPDVIVLVDADWNTAESKQEFLENNPATSLLSAVQNGRFLTVPFAATESGVSTASAVADLATQLGRLPR